MKSEEISPEREKAIHDLYFMRFGKLSKNLGSPFWRGFRAGVIVMTETPGEIVTQRASEEESRLQSGKG